MRIKWTARAIADLEHVEAYITQDNPQAAVNAVLKIIDTISLLKEQPGLGRAGRISGTKELVIPNTPYIVPYRVKDNIVQILRVYHSSRIWPDRI